MPRINIQTPVRFECQKGCSNCCEIGGGYVFVSDKNILHISRYLGITAEEFTANYTHLVEDGTKRCLNDKDNAQCIFLEDGKCSIYPVRPLQCRTFPFWPQNMKSEKRWAQTCQECPGIGKGKHFSREEIEEILKGKAVNSDK